MSNSQKPANMGSINLAIGAAAISLISFFLPLVTVSFIATVSISAFDLATEGVFVVFLCMGCSLVALMCAIMARSNYQAAIGTIISSVIGMVLMFLAMLDGSAGFRPIDYAGIGFYAYEGALLAALILCATSLKPAYTPPAQPQQPVAPNPAYRPQPQPAAPQVVMNSHLGITCLNGPMKGQTFRVGPQGMIIGRDHDCAIRFPSSTPGISRHHCSLRWQQGVLTLSDMGSTYGTFMADGRKLPPQYPTQLAAGSRFYLANSGYQFQVVITG